MVYKKRIIMNVDVPSSLRDKFNALCLAKGMKKSFVLLKIIEIWVDEEERKLNRARESTQTVV